MEFLSYADRAGAERVVSRLAGADIHVILTVRDARSVIPAQWQTACRNGGKVPYRKFVSGVAKVIEEGDLAEGGGARLFRRSQGIPRMIDAWLPVVGRKHFHVVTVPTSRSDPTILWQRFASVLGVDPDVVPGGGAQAPMNPSLGLPSSELLRRLNIELGRLPAMDYNVLVKGALARAILEHRIPEEPRLQLNRRGLRLARTWNTLVREAIVESRATLVGSLDDLPLHPRDPSLPKALPKASAADLLAAAATARDGLTAVNAKLEDLRAELTGPGSTTELDPPINPRTPSFLDPGWMGRTSPDHWHGTTDPVTAAVSELADLVRRGIDVHHDLDKAGLTVTSRR
jgi:hypothetical protein